MTKCVHIGLFLFVITCGLCAQNKDSVFFWNKKKISGTITEITDSTITLSSDSARYLDSYDRKQIRGYSIRNEYRELKTITPKRNALKLHLAGPIYNFVALGYERTGRRFAFEADLGYINSEMNINKNQADEYYGFYTGSGERGFHDGGFLIAGARVYPFAPLYKEGKLGYGFFVALDGFIVCQKFRGVHDVIYSSRYLTTHYNTMDITLYAGGLILKNGFKFNLAERFMIEFAGGIGIGARDSKITNKLNDQPIRNNYLDADIHNNFHILNMTNQGILVSGSATLGYSF